MLVWAERPGGRIATTFWTPWMYLNVYRASSERLAAQQQQPVALDGVPIPIAQFLPPIPHRL